MKAAEHCWMRIDPGPDSLTVTCQVELTTARQVIAFAWDMARAVTVWSWWHRPAVFFCLLTYGFGRLASRSA